MTLRDADSAQTDTRAAEAGAERAPAHGGAAAIVAALSGMLSAGAALVAGWAQGAAQDAAPAAERDAARASGAPSGGFDAMEPVEPPSVEGEEAEAPLIPAQDVASTELKADADWSEVAQGGDGLRSGAARRGWET